jgi:hypothetical protein
MSSQNITASGIQVRFLVALIMVFAVYNPHGYSYYHWIAQAMLEETTGGGAITNIRGCGVIDQFHNLYSSDSKIAGYVCTYSG